VAVASVASKGTLGVATEVRMSAVLGGRWLFVELDRGGWIDAYDGQFTGCRSTGIHVHIEVITPGVGRTGGSSALLHAAGQDGAR
jgi:hypothetical protein